MPPIDGLGPDAPTTVNAQGGKQSLVPYRFDLLDPAAMFAMAHVMHTGAAKYGDDNWRRITVQEHINHAISHLYAHLAGDTSDDHLTHALCRAMMAKAVEAGGDA